MTFPVPDPREFSLPLGHIFQGQLGVYLLLLYRLQDANCLLYPVGLVLSIIFIRRSVMKNDLRGEIRSE